MRFGVLRFFLFFFFFLFFIYFLTKPQKSSALPRIFVERNYTTVWFIRPRSLNSIPNSIQIESMLLVGCLTSQQRKSNQNCVR